MAVLPLMICRMNKCSVATGSNCRSRQPYPTSRQACRIDRLGRKGWSSCWMRRRVQDILAIRGLLSVGALNTHTIMIGGRVLRNAVNTAIAIIYGLRKCHSPLILFPLPRPGDPKVGMEAL